MEFEINLSDVSITEIVWKSKNFGTEKVSRKNGVFVRRVEVQNPKLWWPKGQGEAYLYGDKVVIETVKNHLIGSFILKYGIKTSELVMEQY